MRIFAPLFFIAFISRAEIEAVPSLLDLVKSADIIAVGTLLDSQENTTGATLTIKPLYFFKGTSRDSTLTFQSPGTRRSLVVNMPRIGSQVLIFSQMERSGSSSNLLSPGSGNTLGDRLIACDGIQISPVATGASPLPMLIQFIAQIHQLHPSQTTLLLLVPLAEQRVELPVTIKIFRGFASVSDPGVRETGLNGLAALAQPSAIIEADQLLADSDPRASVRLRVLRRYYDSPDEPALSVVTRWMTGSNADARITAAEILAKLRTPPSVLLLGPALDDPEFEVRSRVIGGLSAFANHVLPGQFTPAPGPWPYRTDQTIAYSFMGPEIRDREERYLAFWRQWWDRNQSAIRAEAAAIATK